VLAEGRHIMHAPWSVVTSRIDTGDRRLTDTEPNALLSPTTQGLVANVEQWKNFEDDSSASVPE